MARRVAQNELIAPRRIGIGEELFAIFKISSFKNVCFLKCCVPFSKYFAESTTTKKKFLNFKNEMKFYIKLQIYIDRNFILHFTYSLVLMSYFNCVYMYRINVMQFIFVKLEFPLWFPCWFLISQFVSHRIYVLLTPIEVCQPRVQGLKKSVSSTYRLRSCRR